MTAALQVISRVGLTAAMSLPGAHLNENLFYGCTDAGGILVDCSFRDVEIVPRQAQRSDFSVSYHYACPGHQVDVGLTLGQDDPSQVVSAHLPDDQSGGGTVHLVGFGPLASVDFNGDLLAQAALGLSCSLTVTGVSTTVVVTEQDLRTDLDSLELQAKPWSLVYAKALVLNGAYIGQQDLALCSLARLVAGLENVFGAASVADIVAGGGESARNLLQAAAKAASDTGVINTGGQDPFTYLAANYAVPVTGIKALAAATCAGVSAAALIPSAAACDGSQGCLQNVKDYNDAKAALGSVRDRAAADYQKSVDIGAVIAPDDWYLDLTSLPVD